MSKVLQAGRMTSATFSSDISINSLLKMLTPIDLHTMTIKIYFHVLTIFYRLVTRSQVFQGPDIPFFIT